MKHLDVLLSTAWDVARDHFGEGKVRARRIAAAVRATSEVYNLDRSKLQDLQGDRAALLARLCFFLPRDCPKIWPILEELDERGALPHRPMWKVLDLGSGLGTTSLGLGLFAAERDHVPELRITAIESDRAAVELHRALLRGMRDHLPETTLQCPDARLPQLSAGVRSERWDVILLGLSLNELQMDTERAAKFISGLVRCLSEGGTLIILEPALKVIAQRLQAIRDALLCAGTADILSPCLHREPCPMLENVRDWCHADLRSPLPERLAEVAKLAGLRDRRLTYAYLTMTKPAQPIPEKPDAWRLVSRLLDSKGKVEAWVCGQGGYKRIMRLDRHYSALNAPLDGLQRGACFSCTATQGSDRIRIGENDLVTRDIAWNDGKSTPSREPSCK